MRKILIAALFIFVGTSLFAKKIEITLWHSLGFHVKELVEDMVDEYNSTHPGVTVDAVFQGLYEEMHVKMMTAAVTRQLPEVAQVQFEYIETYIENGLIQPVGKYIDPELKTDIPDVMWKLMERENDVYGIPFCVSATMFYYNEDAFIRAGLNPDRPPDSWEEMIEAGKVLTADTNDDGTIDRYALMFWTNGFYGLAPFLWANGGNFFTGDGGDIVLTSEEMVRTIGMLRDLVFKHRIMPQKWTAWEGAQAFLTGNLAMGFFTSAAISYGEQNLPWKMRIAPMPTVQGRRYTVLGGSGLVNFATKGKEKRAVNEFATWLVSKENTIRLHETVGYIPVRKSALDSIALKAFHRDNPNYKVTVEALDYARTLPHHAEYYKINSRLREMLERIFLQGSDPFEELQKAEEEINQIIQ
jgi:sn-glycerol 3-phosphate transport system substrate-binding protein